MLNMTFSDEEIEQSASMFEGIKKIRKYEGTFADFMEFQGLKKLQEQEAVARYFQTNHMCGLVR